MEICKDCNCDGYGRFNVILMTPVVAHFFFSINIYFRQHIDMEGGYEINGLVMLKNEKKRVFFCLLKGFCYNTTKPSNGLSS